MQTKLKVNPIAAADSGGAWLAASVWRCYSWCEPQELALKQRLRKMNRLGMQFLAKVKKKKRAKGLKEQRESSWEVVLQQEKAIEKKWPGVWYSLDNWYWGALWKVFVVWWAHAAFLPCVPPVCLGTLPAEKKFSLGTGIGWVALPYWQDWSRATLAIWPSTGPWCQKMLSCLLFSEIHYVSFITTLVFYFRMVSQLG